MKWFYRFLFLLSITALIALPPILAGYQNLALANYTQNTADASRYYELAAKQLFWQPSLYEKAGLASLMSRNNSQHAIQLLTIARENGVLSPAGQIGLGDAYQAIDESDKAISEWENLLSENKEIPTASLRLAIAYHSAQNYEAEQRVLQKWLNADPTNPDASERMGILKAASASPDALALLENAASSSPLSAARLEKLITALKTSSKESSYPLMLCGQALAQMGEWILAEKAFSLAVENNPQYAIAWAWLGFAQQNNKSPAALQTLIKAINLDAKSAPIRLFMGAYWQQAGKPQKAQFEFKKATELEPGNPAWWLALGGAQATDNLPEALKSYTQAVNLEPQNPANWYALATFCVENNAFIEDYGLQAALRAYALAPKNPLYMDMLGRAQMAAGQWQAAEVMFNKALAAGDTLQTTSYHLHLGLLYLQTNRGAQAKYEFENIVKSDPSSVIGRQAIKLLERYFR